MTYDRVLVALVLVWSALLLPLNAFAASNAEQRLRTAALGLAKDDGMAVLVAVQEISQSGSERSAAVLRALRDQRLLVDSSGKLLRIDGNTAVDPISGATLSVAGATRTVQLTNAIRREVEGALARLELSSSETEKRLRAAVALAQSPDAEVVELIRPVLEKERDPEVRAALALAIAKLELSASDPSLRIHAAEIIADSPDMSLKDRLEGMLAQKPDGSYSEPNSEVRKAVASALSAINGRILLVRTVSSAIYGLSLGSVLLLAALGLAITFGLMRVINMAHGEMLMIGAYATFLTQSLFIRYLPSLENWYLLCAVPAAFVVTGLVGVLLERTVIRFLYGRPLETLLATWGLSLLLIQSMRSLFGAQNVTVANPAWLSGGWELMPMLQIPYSRIAVLAFTAVVVAFVWLILQRTSLGLKVRAVTQNREIAASLGIATQQIDTWTFALGSGVAGLGGVALSQLGNVGPELGQQHIIDSFMVVVLGGVGNIVGAIIGGLGLGMMNKFLEPSLGAVLGKISILALLILFIQWRPQGLFALKGRAQE